MIQFHNVSFTYSGERADAGVSNIDFSVKKGEVILLCGASGCGKTTLTRLINGLIPHYYEGTLTGTVSVGGRTIADLPLYDTSQLVGSVFQNPRSQFFNVDTTSELAFGCENLGMPEREVLSRVEQTVKDLSLAPLMDRSIFELSGGEKQKIACGSVSALSPEVLVLDEPTSNMDMDGIVSLKRIIGIWKAQGKTVVVAEHRLHFLVGLADRVIYMKDGRIAEEYSGADFFSRRAAFYRERGLRTSEIQTEGSSVSIPEKYMELNHFRFAYSKKNLVLNIPHAKIPAGHVTAVIGKNGAGKTTFVRCLCGLMKRDKGELVFNGKRLNAKKRLNSCYLVMQDVNHQLFTESVIDEVLLSMNTENEEKAEKILCSLDLDAYKTLHPMSLSGGQKQRVAIASALASEREIIVFDEPTSGLDDGHMRQLAENIRLLRNEGKTVLIVTHDPEFIDACCDDVLHIEHGEVVDGYPIDTRGSTKLKKFFQEGGEV